MTAELLAAFEKQLDPARPEGGRFGCRVIGYGEVSAVLALDALPDCVLKRIAGFATDDEARRYAGTVRRYVDELGGRGVEVVPTEIEIVTGPSRVVYLVQPRMPEDALGHVRLRRADGDELRECIAQVLDRVVALLRTNRERREVPEVAVDSQLSNWAFEPGAASPRLVDVGSPLFRVDGRVQAEGETLYRAFPGPLRWWLRRSQAIERYFNDYFDLRLVILDLIGNFIKEGAAARVPEGVSAANAWLAGQPEADAVGPIQAAAVQRYYERDAGTLELSLRVRRATRFVNTRLLRRRYAFILPGPVKRQ